MQTENLRTPMNAADAIRRLAALFAPFCSDAETMTEIGEIAADHSRWQTCHRLFDRIRRKTLIAEPSGDRIGRSPAPFDPDAPYYILPAALTWRAA